MFACTRVLCVRGAVARISEAPSANVEAIGVASDEVFRVYGLVPGFEKKVSEDDMLRVLSVEGFGVG